MLRRLIPPVCALAAIAFAGCRATPDRGPASEAAPGPWTARDPRLRSIADGDFTARARAGEALVADGARALPLLGPAADAASGEGSRAAQRLDATLRAVVAALPSDALRAAIGDGSASVRAAALSEAARRDDTAATPAVIERLDDEAASVRTAAALALRRLAPGAAAPAPGASREEARAAAVRARAWWRARADATSRGGT